MKAFIVFSCMKAWVSICNCRKNPAWENKKIKPKRNWMPIEQGVVQ